MDIKLSDEQKHALDLFIEGENFLIWGPGGVGKTTFIKYLKAYCEHNYIKYAVTALTGIASTLFGGYTVHGWAGIGLGVDSVEKLYTRIKYNAFLTRRWQQIEVLIIDEISMLSAELLMKLNEIAKLIRNSERPFGGIQVIGSGDFFQLPPIKADFCFVYEKFNDIFPNILLFEQNFRQDGDTQFFNVLNKIRLGICDDSVKKLLLTRLDKSLKNKFMEPIHLYAIKSSADQLNDRRLRKLSGTEYEFKYSWECPKKWPTRKQQTLQSKMLKDVPCRQFLYLKIGTQVIYVANNKNIGRKNGDAGMVIGFSKNGLPIVKFLKDNAELIIDNYTWSSNDKLCHINQCPLIVAWAITIHKSQGMTLEYAVIDIGNDIFDYGQSYTALSRLKNISGLYLTNIDFDCIQANPTVLELYKNLKIES